ncbi:MAG TPA: hypothetical protein IAB06_05460 [Candidatus Avacidaminococcus intestinavium]|uniref:Uncharacterized protein n=1 Tax=Candidatus Avacidaminococcus intestinavium TaxID=2840684 RepID=A0A9D1SLC0_9FIRM|nr:hypothetical protein [Candidatus Avacidaminococcus intestinavium]
MNLCKSNKQKNKGFILVDAIVAVLIVAIGLAALAYMYTNSVKTRIAAERLQVAVQLAGQEMERLKTFEKDARLDTNDLKTKAKVQVGTPKAGAVEYEVTSTVDRTVVGDPLKDEQSTKMLQPVKVIVEWQDPMPAKTELESYIIVDNNK